MAETRWVHDLDAGSRSVGNLIAWREDEGMVLGRIVEIDPMNLRVLVRPAAPETPTPEVP